jgi:hypothetical protein
VIVNLKSNIVSDCGVRHLFDVAPRLVLAVLVRTADENGQRLFAITSSDGTPQNAALTVVQLAAVPLGIGTIAPSAVAAAGGAVLTIRGSGFQSATTLSINGKAATVTFKDSNTLLVVTPALTPGPQQITLTTPDGETVSLDAALTAN